MRIDFSDRLEVRQKEVDGETNWHWVKTDDGGFGDEKSGPMRDWMENHRVKYFKYLKNKDVVVTAGACCGMHVRFFAREFNWVYAFELDPINFHCAVRNNPFENVSLFNCALGGTASHVLVDGGDTHNVGTHSVVDEPGCVLLMPLDSFNLPACDLIQLDVEGYEYKALVGAIGTIKKFRPVIIAEKNSSIDATNQLMHELGYTNVDQSASDNIYTHP